MLSHLTQQQQQRELLSTTAVCKPGLCSVMQACGCARQTSKEHKQQQQQSPAPLLQQHASLAAPVSRHMHRHMLKGLTSTPCNSSSQQSATLTSCGLTPSPPSAPAASQQRPTLPLLWPMPAQPDTHSAPWSSPWARGQRQMQRMAPQAMLGVLRLLGLGWMLLQEGQFACGSAAGRDLGGCRPPPPRLTHPRCCKLCRRCSCARTQGQPGCRDITNGSSSWQASSSQLGRRL